ncbi:MAG: hypothetical protein GEU74_07075, partial [Nitriliruptorales bacterium]|nr:hypothetical protein [Nitriliruptorales bacterium]
MALASPASSATETGAERGRRWLAGSPGQLVALVVAFGLLLASHVGPALPGLEPRGQTMLGIFLWFVILLATEALPPVVLGVSAPLLIVVLNGAEIPKAFNAFSNDVFFLILGAFVLVAVMIETGLGKRIALGIVGLVRSTKATRIMAALMAAGTALHAILPTVAETALFLPISRCFGELSEGRQPSRGLQRANQAMILTVTGLVPLFAGVFFLTAGVPNLVLVGLLSETSGIEISWLDWLIYNLPLWGLIPILYFLVKWWFQIGSVELPNADKVLPQVRAELGPIKKGEIWALICIAIGFTLWVSESVHGISTGMVAIIMIALLFMPWGGLKFGDFGPKVMWGMLFLIGGAISLGNQLFASGAVEWLAQFLVDPIRNAGITSGILVLLILAFALHVARAGIISGGAMAAIFVPLIIGIAQQLDYNVLPFSLILTNALNFA